ARARVLRRRQAARRRRRGCRRARRRGRALGTPHDRARADGARRLLATRADRGAARADARLLAALGGPRAVRGAVARAGPAERTRPQAARLRALRCDRRRADDVAARATRRRPELGLSLRLAARRELRARGTPASRLSRRVARVLLVADAQLAWDATASAHA